MTLNNYLALEKPADTATVEVTPDPLKIVDHVFELWKPYVYRTTKFGLEAPLENLLEEAENLLKQHELPKAMETGNYSLNGPHKRFLGLFYTALLNSGVESITITTPIDLLGFKLRRGTLEIHADDCKELGECVRGGTIINHNKSMHMGLDAKGGVFINYGTISHLFGLCAEGGTFINAGTAGDVGENAIGGTFVNHGKITYYFAPGARGGCFVNYGKTEFFAINTFGGTYLNQGYAYNFGCRAKNGIYINHEQAYCFAQDVDNGIFVNFGLSHHIGKGAYGGLFVNNGTLLGELGYCARYGLFIATRKPEPQFLKKKAQGMLVENDNKLNEILAKLAKTETAAQELENYCREHYGHF